MDARSPLAPSPLRPPRRRRGRSFLGRRPAILIAVVVVAAFVLSKSIRPDRPAPSKGSQSHHSHSAPHPAAAPSAASIHTRATRSRLGLALGQPPLALTPAAPGQALYAAFRHPPRAGMVFDLDSGRVLWERNATHVLPVASLAKMMTALLVARSEPPDARVLVTKQAVDAAGSKVGLLPLHKRVPMAALLYGLLLPSGNDAAVVLAESVSGSVGAFVAKMNEEAANLGLGCTRFTSPDGLDNGNSSCAVDLAELADADLSEPLLRKVAGSRSAVVPFPIKGGKLFLYNNNPLLRYGFPGATGLKTGETEAAGLCLVGTAERHGVRLGVVLLHSPELGRQAAFLLSRAYERVYRQPRLPEPPIPAGR